MPFCLQVNLQREGAVGACNAVVFSDRFEILHEWLVHYSRLGVAGFRIYYTNQSLHWDEHRLHAHLELRKPLAAVDPPQSFAFAFPQVTWVYYEHLSTEDRWFYSQGTMYSECIYRNRHAYQYLIMYDMDEFFVIRDPRFTHDGGLGAFLDHHFRPRHAALGIYR